MFSVIRRLTDPNNPVARDGLKTTLAQVAINWAVFQLGNHIDDLNALVAERDARIAELEEALQATFAEQAAAPAADYPAPEDVDPLGKAVGVAKETPGGPTLTVDWTSADATAEA